MAALLLLSVATAVLTSWYREVTPITVTVDGLTETVHTRRPDVGALLTDLGLELRPGDWLQPSPGTGLRPGLAVTLERVRPYLIYADGTALQTYSHAQTVGDVLAEAGLQMGARDELWMDGAQVAPDAPLPGGDGRLPSAQSQIVPVGYARARAWIGHEPKEVRLNIRRAVPITVNDGSVPYTIFTTAPTVGEALLREHLTLYLGDSVRPSLGSRVHSNMRVVIERSKPVLVTADGRTVRTRTRAKTVGDTLVDLGMIVSGSDKITPSLHEAVVDNIQVRVVRVLETVAVERQVIPFESIMGPDDQLEIDHQRLAQAGKDGEYRRRFNVAYEDGSEVSRRLTDAWVAAQPVTRIVSYGRKIVSRPLETPEGTISYWRKISMYATAYSPATSGTPISAPWYGRTRLGWQLRKGIVAVDPNIIGLQSRVYVPGYGMANAGDTGGGVRGRMIDLGYEDNNLISWHQWVEVYLLDPPPPRSKIQWVLPKYPEGQFPRNRR